MNPNPKIAVPMIGIIQCSFAWADQPYQLQKPIVNTLSPTVAYSTYNKPIGTKNDPIMRIGIRISGFPTPPFLSDSCHYQSEPVNNQLCVDKSKWNTFL